MTAALIDGRRYAAEFKSELAEQARSLAAEGARPGLATVLVGDSYPAMAYERRLRRLADELGCHYVGEAMPGDVAEADVLATIGKLVADPRVTGILVLRPVPPHVSEIALYNALDPLKDIEAVHPINAGLLSEGRPHFVPSTPASAFHVLDRYLSESGRDPAAVYERSNLVVVGRSNNVGKPAVLLGLARNATVVSCDVHSYRAGLLAEHVSRADILIVAAGVAGLVTGRDVKEGVIAVDVGINPVEDEVTGKVRLVGDLDSDSVRQVAAALTPVPGGVGPVTDLWLLRNTVSAAALPLRIANAWGEQHPGSQLLETALRTSRLPSTSPT
ncbi:MAG: bifunctional 5,10-methylene-tetrahydrofolate dehydrogenase/5,10-methylene-tetrahydrofolate cyclohydrolase [Pseudonocardiaceae bacterium]|nr:bifunctional 5,10-methylene-tetrahydrofolate dehydrogenase/5,10-methylene-tetrahydrofolate cyclohydrolase [Pseudonocardiaceae bacterium]